MPCYDPHADAESREKLRKHLHRVTRAACSLARQIEATGQPIEDVHAQVWWQQHKREDEARAAKS